MNRTDATDKGYFFTVRDHITSAKGLVGGVRKMAIFSDVQYYLWLRRVGGGVRKSPKNVLT